MPVLVNFVNFLLILPAYKYGLRSIVNLEA